MKAIIIEEQRFVDLLDELRAAKESLAHTGQASFLRKPENVSQGQWEQVVQDVHSRFHFIFVRWAQREGASCVR